MFIANDLKKTYDIPELDKYREIFIDLTFLLVERFIADKPMFTMEDFSAIYFDEIAMGTACHKDIFSTIYLEIDQPMNYRPKNISNKKPKNDKITAPELYTTLEDFREGIFNQAVAYLDGNNLIWQEKNAVCIKTTIYDDVIGIQPYYIRIIPCLTHYNKDNVRGLLYHQNNEVNIEYPLLALENYESKNSMTDDLYRQVILVFKNILLKEKNIERLPGEIIETIVYNIPTEMFLDDNHSTLLNMINYLRNKSIRDYVTLDEQDFAFVSAHRSMSLFYVKHVLKLIEKYLSRAK